MASDTNPDKSDNLECPEPIICFTQQELATERTILANERTFLSYIRTSMTLFVPGITLLELTESTWIRIISILFIPGGILTFIYGASRFIKKRNIIRHERDILDRKTN